MPRAPLALFVLAAGCWVEEHEPLAVCVLPEGGDASHDDLTPPLTYPADEPVEFVFEFGGLDVDTRAPRCSLARHGNAFTIAASYERHRRLVKPDSAAGFEIRCPTPPLPPGEYSFTHAGETQSFTIPATVTVPCL